MGPAFPALLLRATRVSTGTGAVGLGAVLALLASIAILVGCAGEDAAPTPGATPETTVAAAPGTVSGAGEPAAAGPVPTSDAAVATTTPGVQSDRAAATPGLTATTIPTQRPAPELPPEPTEDDSPGDIPFEDLEIVTLLPYDGIPAILDPAFVSAEDAWYQYASDETVLGLSINGDHRAYSVPHLSSREIVNDVVGGVPVAVTW